MATVILGIESSCDETAASICIDGEIMSNEVATQIIHRQYGGVVPELASRAHQQNIIPVVDRALRLAGITMKDLSGIAFTQGPGLLGSLLVGTSFAKGVAFSLSIPLLPVHHMKAHILSHFIDKPKPDFPFLCLTVSGGHTQIVKVSGFQTMEVIGETTDDAVGEAFDKAAKMLGLHYPGGPEIDLLAKKGNSRAFSFSKTSMQELNFSFSGIKTSILYFLREKVKENPDFIKDNINDLAASIQFSLIQMLFEKLEMASKQTGINEIAIAGGVSANSLIRETLHQRGIDLGWNVFVPKFEYCTDNAAMIAISGYYQLQNGVNEVDLEIQALPRLPF